MTSGVLSIAAGGYHTCAITTVGALKCWGRNDRGQLGNNTTTDYPLPTNVYQLSSGVASIYVGGKHSCAVMDTGALKCWGDLNSKDIPTDDTRFRSGVAKVAVGAGHICALRDNGSIMCWGRNTKGQLGDGTVSTSGSAEVALSSPAIDVEVGSNHTCAVLSTGSVKCWGENMYGELGNGSTVDSAAHVDVLE